MKIQINSVDSISISTHGGKMEGIRSLSTYKGFNERCQRLAQNPNNICHYCYVDKTIKRYNTKAGNKLENALISNYYVLTSRLLTKEEIVRLPLFNDKYFRFEAFGDLNNETQLINYVNIAKYYKTTQFALFTKHFDILIRYLRQHKMPNNINIVLSGLQLNNLFNEYVLNVVKKYHKNTISFVVYDEKVENHPVINCKKHCSECLNCYKKGKKFNVVEALK